MNSKIKKIIIIFIAAAVAMGMVFLLQPKLKEINAQRVEIYVFSKDLQGGHQINEDDLIKKSISKKDLDNQISKKEEIVGKYTNSFVYADDFITNAKISNEFLQLEEKMYLSLKVATEQALAGELIEGDIVTIFNYDDISEKTYINNNLMYVKVVRVKNRLTEDIERVKEKNITEDLGVAYKTDSIIPQYITVEVNTLQAQELINSSQTGFFYLAYRGNVNQNPELLEVKETVLVEGSEE